MKQNFNFTHPLTVTRIDAFVKYMKNDFKKIEKTYYPQIAVSFLMSVVFTPFNLLESALYNGKAKKETVKEPVFVLGHWRCGTTLVQYLLSRDKKFGIVDPLMSYTLNFYHILGGIFKPLIPPQLADGRPMDNMKYAMDLPLEEYIVFSTFEAASVYPLNFFPQSFMKYSNNAFVDKLPEKVRKHWMKNYDMLLKKCTMLNNHKQLLLKSPDNTCRVNTIRRMYPDAKFANIYRNPYDVIRSTINLYDKIFDLWSLEKIPDRDTLEDMIIESFAMMYKSYFEEVKALDENTIYEIRFEDFEKDPFPDLEKVYKQLGLGDYEKAKPYFEEYWAEQADYKKNSFDYPASLMKKINERLGFYFEHYGYEKKPV